MWGWWDPKERYSGVYIVPRDKVEEPASISFFPCLLNKSLQLVIANNSDVRKSCYVDAFFHSVAVWHFCFLKLHT